MLKVILFIVVVTYFFDMSRLSSLEKRLTVIERKVEILDNQKNLNQKEKTF